MNVIRVLDAITSIHPGSCNGYTNLTDPWRNRAFTQYDYPGFPTDDNKLLNKWWRFTGIVGDTANDYCRYYAGSFYNPWYVEIILSVAQTPAAPLLNVPVPLWEAVFVSLGMKSPKGTFLLMVPMAVLGQTKERAFLGTIAQQLKDNPNILLPEAEVSGANSNSPKAVSSEGDADTGSVILDISEGLVSSLVEPNQDGTNKTLQTAVVDLSVQTFSLGSNDGESNVLLVKGISMEVNLEALAQDNNALRVNTVNGLPAPACGLIHGVTFTVPLPNSPFLEFTIQMEDLVRKDTKYTQCKRKSPQLFNLQHPAPHFQCYPLPPPTPPPNPDAAEG
ncbi:unnamed protein product [Gadus morhua 'NCC']